jgi:hypothetical protein
MKVSHSVISTGIAWVGLSASLMACGGGSSNTNPGLGGSAGQVAAIAPKCPNNIRIDEPGRSPVTAEATIPVANYSLSSMSMYVYDPTTGDSFSASANESDRFQVNVDCNQTTQGGRYSQNSAGLPDSLSSSRKPGPNDQERHMTVRFDNEVATGEVVMEPDNSGTFLFDQIGHGRQLTDPNTYMNYQAFLLQDGGVEVRTKMETPPNPATGLIKLVYTSAIYSVTDQDLNRGHNGR